MFVVLANFKYSVKDYTYFIRFDVLSHAYPVEDERTLGQLYNVTQVSEYNLLNVDHRFRFMSFFIVLSFCGKYCFLVSQLLFKFKGEFFLLSK